MLFVAEPVLVGPAVGGFETPLAVAEATFDLAVLVLAAHRCLL